MKIKFWEKEKEVEARDIPRNERSFHGEAVVVCDKCKCFLYKDDAIRQNSRIVNSNLWHGRYWIFSGNPEGEEKIEKVYMCPKCNKPKKSKKN